MNFLYFLCGAICVLVVHPLIDALMEVVKTALDTYVLKKQVQQQEYANQIAELAKQQSEAGVSAIGFQIGEDDQYP